jgi:putative exosortase-associated protein (TIGR04073 family)
MLKRISLLAAMALVGVFMSGCANTQKKFSRGMTNLAEPLRMGDLRRSMEQSGLFVSPDSAYGGGFFEGLNKTLARTGLGVYEVITAPLPPYDPIWTSYVKPGIQYPDNYSPNLVEDSTFATDTNLGFSGGDVVPMAPGSRFRIFDTH